MDLKAEIAIISIFGRGHLLAVELAQAGVPVTLLDVSGQMGKWKPEDYEGPFGYFAVEGLAKERLVTDEESLELKNGMTVWLSDGPIEFRGPTVTHRLSQLQVHPETLSYIRGETRIEALRSLSFRETWPAHFSHGLTSSVSTIAPEAFKEGLRRNLFSPFFVRQATSEGFEKSLKWCESKGVKILRGVELKDLSFEESRKLAGFEVRTDRPGIFQAEQFVICLTAEECGMLSHKIQNSLFGNTVHEPEWAWLRYRIRLQGKGPLAHLTRDQIPQHCVVIEDLMLPWTHENLLILQRTPVKDQFDAWMKIPNTQRFHSQYLQERAFKLKTLLESKVPENEMLLLEMPLEAEATFQEVGPARHPIFSRALRILRKDRSVKNLMLHSPESWGSLSWEGQFEYQKDIFKVLKNWWDKKEELRIKREAKETAKKNRLEKKGIEK